MVTIGEITELINATKVHLALTSAGATFFIMLQELDFHIGRPEAREGTDFGSIYFYGHGDNYFEATMLLTKPEITTFVGYTVLDSNGALPSNSFDLIYNDVSGATSTIAVTCEVPDLNFNKPIEGGVKTRIRFRITEEITSADIS